MLLRGLSRSCPRRRPFARARLAPPILCALTLMTGASAQDDSPPLEYQVKAAFLFNFARFVEWPPAAFRDREASFVIGVVDDEVLARALDQAVRGKVVDGRAFEVRRLQNAHEAGFCQMLYLGSADTSRLAGLLRSIRSSAILTIGDAQGFTHLGGMINFIMQGHRLRFEINPDAAERAGLRISSKLLQLATIVRDASPGEDGR